MSNSDRPEVATTPQIVKEEVRLFLITRTFRHKDANGDPHVT